MSVWTEVELEVNDPVSIKSALLEMGYECEEHQQAQLLTGFGGRTDRSKMGHIIIRKASLKGCSYGDLGFLRQENGQYKLVADFHYGKQDAFLKSFKQLYGKHKVIRQVRKMGFHVTSTKTTEDGKLKIRVRA